MNPRWGAFAITWALLALAAWLLWQRVYDGLAGSIIGLAGAYWLPTRPNRLPP